MADSESPNKVLAGHTERICSCNQEAAMKFVKSVAEGDRSYAKELCIGQAVLFGRLSGVPEHGAIEKFFHNVDATPGNSKFKAHVDVRMVEKNLAATRVWEEGWGGSTSDGWSCVAFTLFICIVIQNT